MSRMIAAQQPTWEARRPLGAVKRIALLVVGTIAVGLGTVGLLLPILPTTPFLLLAAACYLRSSDRLYFWLRSHSRLGPRLESYLHQRAVPLRVKVISLAIAWVSIGSFALFVTESPWLRVVLALVLVGKTAVMLRVRTAGSGAGR